jgi:hypothetical protein
LVDHQAAGPPAQSVTCRPEDCTEAYETVKNGSAGIKQVLLPNNG